MCLWSGPLARENAELRRQLEEWEALRRALAPYAERTGNLEVLPVHDALTRVASLALAHGVTHQQLLTAVRPEPRGAALGPAGGIAESCVTGGAG